MNHKVGFFVLLSALLTLCACGSSNYGASIHGTKGGYSLSNAKAKPLSLMVARKIDLPLFIVLDANKVKDTWQLETDACAINAHGCETFNLMDVQEFVRRDQNPRWSIIL